MVDEGDSVSVTGQTVVYKLMISVVTWPILAGQFVLKSNVRIHEARWEAEVAYTSGAQEVIV